MKAFSAIDVQLLDTRARELSGWRRGLLEFLYFGFKEARACLFVVLFFAAVHATDRLKSYINCNWINHDFIGCFAGKRTLECCNMIDQICYSLFHAHTIRCGLSRSLFRVLLGLRNNTQHNQLPFCLP